MNTDDTPTMRTSPPFFLRFQEGGHTLIFYIFKILDLTHIIPCSISFIQLFQHITRELIAFKTEPNLFLFYMFTISNLTSSDANRDFCMKEFTSRTCILIT